VRKTLSEKWDMESIFPGGSESDPVHTYIADVKKDVARLQKELRELQSVDCTSSDTKWVHMMKDLHSIEKRRKQAAAYVNCLTTRNRQHKKMTQLRSDIHSVSASVQTCVALLEEKLAPLEDGEGIEEWQSVVRELKHGKA
jgi:oligoendopeptidase F